jgi:hypothetical protein
VTITGAFDTWVGVMFAKTMKLSDVHIVEYYKQDDLKFKLFDSWTDNNPPQPDRDVGGYTDLNNVEYKVIDGKPVITYTRLYKTGDKYDKDLEKVNL